MIRFGVGMATVCLAAAGVFGGEVDSSPLAPRVTLLGQVVVSSEVVEPDGTRTPVAELSGITWLGGEKYLAVMDSSDRALVLSLIPAPDGAPTAGDSDPPGYTVRLDQSIALDAVRDWEDVAAGPGETDARSMFAVEEDTPAIREFLIDWPAARSPPPPRPRTVISLAEVFRSARANRGPESLTLEPDSPHLWTANEEPLERDGPPVAEGTSARVRLVRVPVDGAEAPQARRQEWIYPVDPPHERLGLVGGPLYCGVVALVALGQGRLLVLERSAAAGLPPFENRIFLVDTGARAAESEIPADLRDQAAAPVAKSLLWRGALGVNLEGLCAGPRLPDGRRLLVGVADNGAAGRPSVIALFAVDE